jgi:phospho-N-acetylmuramoyl-pentapeptide-transferase
VLTFFSTILIVNAINITDGLDGLASGMTTIILVVLAIVTFLNHTYIATTVLGVCVAILIAFMFYNINPAQIFMGDSGAFALGGLIASTIYLLNMRIGILVPFAILFLLFIIELGSSAFQMGRKRLFKRKLFPIAPFHHYLEYKGLKEYTIVMKLWLIQAILALITIVIIFGQYLQSDLIA